MQIRRFLFISILYLSSAGLTACSTKKELKSQDVVSVTMGDPEDIIAGTIRDEKIPKGFLIPGETLYLQKQIEFVSKKKTKSSVDELIGAGRDLKNGAVFTVHSPDEKTFVIASGDFSLTLRRSDDESFRVSSIQSRDKTKPVQFLHFSTTPDARIFSFLILDPNENKSVLAFYFTRYDVNSAKPVYVDTKFNYTFGAGVRVRWPKDKPVEISACQGIDSISATELKESLDLWKSQLGAQLDVQLATNVTVRPISDLNQKCVAIVDGYLSHPHPGFMLSGVTYSLADFESHTFVDADILLFKDEFKKRKDFRGSALEKWRRRTFIHELGHFFGLDHQYQISPSIMSYDESLENRLYFYDQQALRTLYAD